MYIIRSYFDVTFRANLSKHLGASVHSVAGELRLVF